MATLFNGPAVPFEGGRDRCHVQNSEAGELKMPLLEITSAFGMLVVDHESSATITRTFTMENWDAA